MAATFNWRPIFVLELSWRYQGRLLLLWNSKIPVTWFQAFNPFMIFAFTPLIIAFWAWQEMALGCFGVALSYLIMAGAR